MIAPRVSVIAVGMLFLAPLIPLGATISGGAELNVLHRPLAVPSAHAFASVSNFEDHLMDGWTAIQGGATVGTYVTYDGEPSLGSTATAHVPQIDQTQTGFVVGASSVSFQALLRASPGGQGFVGLVAGSQPVAVVGIGGGNVWAGTSPANATIVGTVPASGTAQPNGWVELLVNVASPTPRHPHQAPWTMSLYVDRTDVAVSTTVSLPGASNYTGGLLETVGGTVHYTNLIFSSYQIPTTLSGYNNMDGYGQGSGLLVSVLPAYTTLSAGMNLTNWSVPQKGILSFQINAMNRTGTVKSTCRGFFQLGVDLDPNGRIAPWYVPGVNCVAYYFATGSPHISAGFKTPPNSHLTLTIFDNIVAHTIDFTIVDLSVSGPNRTSTTSIPYSGSEFFGTYTQIEWQPCCSHFPISSYGFNGSLGNLRISGGNVSQPEKLNASYMLPFALDVPPSWNFGFYNQAKASYEQVG